MGWESPPTHRRGELRRRFEPSCLSARPPHSASPVQCDSRLLEYGLAQQCQTAIFCRRARRGDQPSASTGDRVHGETLQKRRWGLRRPWVGPSLAGPKRITPERHQALPASRLAGRRASGAAVIRHCLVAIAPAAANSRAGFTEAANPIGHGAKPNVLVARALH